MTWGRDLSRCEIRIRSYRAERALVAFSGGVDSSVVLALAARTLGRSRVTALTALSASYPAGELAGARAAAAGIGVPHRTIHTGEVEREAYARNDADRCFHCKVELYGALRRLAETAGPGVAVLAGANADDLRDVRPGMRAAERLGIRNPLLEEGIGKEAVRVLARRLGLPVAEKPTLACLSSRVAYGVRITPELLARIDRAERKVRALGFDVVRVRHLGRRASIEVAPGEVDRLASHPGLAALLRGLGDMGWREVTVDQRGYRTGALNVLGPPAGGTG